MSEQQRSWDRSKQNYWILRYNKPWQVVNVHTSQNVCEYPVGYHDEDFMTKVCFSGSDEEVKTLIKEKCETFGCRKLENGTKVSFDNSVNKGYGMVIGISHNWEPNLGVGYIIELDRNMENNIPSESYPYRALIIFQSQLKVISRP